MGAKHDRRLLAIALLLAATLTHAQAPKSPDEMTDQELAAAVADSLGPAAATPVTRELIAGIVTSSQHDSITGWANIVTPSVAYRFNRRFSVEAATPVFLYLYTQETIGNPNGPGPTFTRRQTRHGIAGDTVFSAHFYAPPIATAHLGLLYNVPTVSLVVPTGSVSDGLGAGAVTFAIVNRLQSSVRLNPYIDLGVGTINRLQNRRLERDETTHGPSANFAAGVVAPLPRRSRLTLEAYEQLPFGNQSIAATAPRPGGPPSSATTGAAEDNGLNSIWDLPLQRRLTFSAFYSRSLRRHEDTTGFAFTVFLRPHSRSY